MRDACEDIEALGGAGDGFGHQLTCEAGKGHAVTGKSLHIEYIGREPSEIRPQAYATLTSASVGNIRSMRLAMDSASCGGCTAL